MDRLIVFLKFDEREKTMINAADLDVCGICRQALKQALKGGRNADHNTG
jgi:hypothetical protein